MRKYILNSFLLIIGIIIFSLIYLSVYGIKTKKFNNIISEQIKQFDPKVSLKFNDVFFKLNLKEKSIKIDTKNAKIYTDNEFLNLSKINANLDIIKFINKNNSIENIEILTEKTKIKNVTNFINSYKFNLQRLIFYNQIENGEVKIKFDINFKEDGKSEFSINGKVTDAKINILNKASFGDINFDFYIHDNKYSFKNISFINEGINFESKNLLIKKLNENYNIIGDIFSKKGLINLNNFLKLLNYNIDFIDNKKILVETKNKFNFTINSKRKIKNLNLQSQINFKEIFINKKYQSLIFFKNGMINTKYSEKELKIEIDSGYAFLNNNYSNNEKDNIKINIVKKKNKDSKIVAIIKNKNNKINSKELLSYLKIDKSLINDQELIFTSNNHLTFNVDKKNKIKNLKIKSNLNLKKLLVRYKSQRLKKILINYNDKIETKNNLIDIEFNKNKLNFNTTGSYSFNNKFDKFNITILKNKKNFKFNSKIEIKNNPIILKDINYKKEKDIFANVEFAGEYLKNKKIKFKDFNYSENHNKISITNLYLSDNYKIIDIEKLKLEYLNENKNLNQLSVLKKNNKFKLDSKNFDGKTIIENLINGSSNNNFLNNFNNLNSEMILNFNNLLINKNDFLSNISGNLFIKKNKIISGNITSKLNDINNFTLDIKTNSQKEKITKLLIDKPRPFVMNYKFIKGFNGGKLSYKSVEKNDVSRSKLKIYDFKVREVPVLAKLLTLASLQGIADLLTGEGIRFDELDMDFKTKSTITTIEEMYAIGPAISILMEGYIEKDKLTSLRGTLVPATTINKSISKIPLLGKILVGKEVGEGVFGVSFKIKGHPKKLKTNVNPVKTLTPRFITRTLDKLKRN